MGNSKSRIEIRVLPHNLGVVKTLPKRKITLQTLLVQNACFMSNQISHMNIFMIFSWFKMNSIQSSSAPVQSSHHSAQRLPARFCWCILSFYWFAWFTKVVIGKPCNIGNRLNSSPCADFAPAQSAALITQWHFLCLFTIRLELELPDTRPQRRQNIQWESSTRNRKPRTVLIQSWALKSICLRFNGSCSKLAKKLWWKQKGDSTSLLYLQEQSLLLFVGPWSRDNSQNNKLCEPSLWLHTWLTFIFRYNSVSVLARAAWDVI